MSFKKSTLSMAIAASLAVGLSTAAQARDTIQIAGSSTVLPFASIVAEEFGASFPQFNTPVVGSGGSGGGLRQFCQGVGENTIDIANSSRAIRSGELENCAANGVNEVLEVMFGYDGIVFASRADRGEFALTPQHVFAAAAAQIPQDGQLVANPYTRWSEIDADLPDQEIVLVIPASNHGTREVFEEKVLHAGCDSYAEIEGDACNNLRGDGRIIEIAGDYTETLARLDAQADAVGVFGLSFYDQNRDRLQVATVDGVTPSLETIGSGEYPVSRPLFFYVKGEHLDVIPGLAEYTEFFLSDAISGFGSPLEDAGLIPMDDDERAQALEQFQARTVVSAE
ncbi:phosphonate ABC transporter substrate-binding protein [Halomonas daqingensis]|uniref:Phosphonate ABC transporter substrate-binding protein n=1 Tax=Billgrantia desiderata TaxID=52021 RepID=A0AAW4YZS5_9GAMM|nr:substrate-binding domain-containing protein [Halomonas desiderata]MCE8012181.1 phosphonate ABC transporter substrate-binding protein [Halomonas desiderata]MCE8027945.1 phosphonate ABC transporter substrate-binding protein [Halomonas desiderata]MCE8043135.1 phosphonate ABC transporter substrate-binding protein [Halomonas desiderata]MCE8047768.1 phosphonate ABC transporter substrate-binding protein [Halomonas desiderata]MCE8053550.1 phosphonate ABC transporter substrate-binding protein [Halom